MDTFTVSDDTHTLRKYFRSALVKLRYESTPLHHSHHHGDCDVHDWDGETAVLVFQAHVPLHLYSIASRHNYALKLAEEARVASARFSSELGRVLYVMLSGSVAVRVAGWQCGWVAGWLGGRVAGWQCGSAAVWQCGRVAGWQCGWVAVWQCGWVAGWQCGWVAVWQCGSVAVWLGGRVAVWLGGSVAVWLGGSVAVRVAVWQCGWVAVRQCGRVAGWQGGWVAGWQGGSVAGSVYIYKYISLCAARLVPRNSIGQRRSLPCCVVPVLCSDAVVLCCAVLVLVLVLSCAVAGLTRPAMGRWGRALAPHLWPRIAAAACGCSGVP
jgi:hypothetical protein